jgi:enoyl-CoA hydratase
VVAAETAKFGLPEVKRGLVAAAGGLLRLPRRIPYQIAMELALTGEFLDAPRGYHFGLVNRLTATGGALAAARELAATISGNGPLAVRATKSVIAGAGGWPAGEFWDRQRVITEPVFTSDDAREGALAFAEKRPPRWSGR